MGYFLLITPSEQSTTLPQPLLYTKSYLYVMVSFVRTRSLPFFIIFITVYHHPPPPSFFFFLTNYLLLFIYYYYITTIIVVWCKKIINIIIIYAAVLLFVESTIASRGNRTGNTAVSKSLHLIGSSEFNLEI